MVVSALVGGGGVVLPSRFPLFLFSEWQDCYLGFKTLSSNADRLNTSSEWSTGLESAGAFGRRGMWRFGMLVVIWFY